MYVYIIHFLLNVIDSQTFKKFQFFLLRLNFCRSLLLIFIHFLRRNRVLGRIFF